jgi:hypothetical protein
MTQIGSAEVGGRGRRPMAAVQDATFEGELLGPDASAVGKRW